MDEPDVLEGALRIAREEYPDLEPAAYREKIDAFARGAKASSSGRRAVEQLNDHVFGRLGFSGNRDDYYDPRNSYLNDVIDRRTGIPISLATVYCEIARRTGLAAFGVGFPGHFLVRVRPPGADVIVDCFNARILTRDDCQALLESTIPGQPQLSDSMFEIAGPRDILSRMLNNLRRIHAARKDYARVVRWIGLDLAFKPEAVENFRDRGLAYVQMEEFGKALADLERYLRAAPDAPDRAQVGDQVQLLRKLLSHLN